MSPSQYLDYQVRVQNLKKGALEVSKIGAEIGRFKNDTKASGLYGNALKELTGATDKDGNTDLGKISAGSKQVLYDHASKGLADSSRAMLSAIQKHTAATANYDDAAKEEAEQEIETLKPIVQGYGETLRQLHGHPKAAPAQAAPNQSSSATPAKIAAGQQVTLKSGQRVTVTKVNPDGTFDYK